MHVKTGASPACLQNPATTVDDTQPYGGERETTDPPGYVSPRHASVPTARAEFTLLFSTLGFWKKKQTAQRFFFPPETLVSGSDKRFPGHYTSRAGHGNAARTNDSELSVLITEFF